MDKNYLVNKSNSLITANYDLSLQEQKLILTLASTVQPSDEDFKEYEFKIKDFMELLEIKNNSGYAEVKQMTKSLMRKVFEIREGKDTVQMAWFSSVRYREGEGIVILKFDNCLKPYLLQLKEFYTSYKLENILSLKSKYALRLYEIMKCNDFRKSFKIELDEFKRILGITEKSYSVYQNVKNKVILQAQKELSTKTDISFEFEEIKTGRKVTSLKFIIKSNKKVNAPIDEVGADKQETPLDQIEKDIKLIMDITNNEFSEKTAMLFRELSKGDISLVQKIYDYTTTKNITEGKVGYMRQLFKNFEEPIKSTGVGTTKFNNFEPRNKSARYLYLEEQCLLGQATEEERREFDEMRGNSDR